MVTRLWKFLNTDIKELASIDSVDGTIEVAEAALGLAETLQKDEIQQLLPLLQHGDSLLEALNSPLTDLAESTLPFVKIATSLLKFYLQKTQQEPPLSQAVALVSQAAYLESFQATILASPSGKVQAWLKQKGQQHASERVKQQLQQLGDRLAELELDDQEARLAIVFFHQSKFAIAFNSALIARLEQLGIPKANAMQIAEKVARNADRYMLPALAAAGGATERLVKWYQMGGQAVLEKYASIDAYLKEQIESRPQETVFNEQFTFQDIYVPLKAQPIQRNGEPDSQPAIEIEQWAKNLLVSPSQQDRVLFIQGGPGRGKSVFCRMFADWVRQHLHPSWTPILIRLRDVRTIEKDFEETLRKAVDRDFADTDPGWLTDRNIRFLFLLDGFDELLMEGRTSGGLEEFLRQVGRFQESCANNSEKGHRVLITGRSLSLHSIDRLMPSNLERVEILPMDDELQGRWLAQWGRLIGADPAHLTEILNDSRLPDRVRELAREPLLLYLLAAMHRDGELHLEMFEGASGAGAKVLIYEKTLNWVLTKQRPDWLQRQITEFEHAGLRRILAEAGLCVVQAGGECASIAQIEDRLKNDDAAKALIAQARQRLGDNPLKNALAAFYLQPGRSGAGSVEFAHKSFSEFLCAERLKEAIEDWSKSGDRRKEFYVPTEQMDWEIYDLLGYGGLTLEIVEYLMTLLTQSQAFDPVRLFQRLEQFYLRWCDGEFIDAPHENLPQRKMRSIKQSIDQPPKTQLGQRQVDVFTGLNVLILLLELHRYAQTHDTLKLQIAFFPCGQPDTEGFDQSCLYKLIGYSCCVDALAFNKSVGKFLRHANLSGADLSRAYLSRANLSDADLSAANLSRADLNETNWEGVRGLETAIDVPEALKQQLGLE